MDLNNQILEATFRSKLLEATDKLVEREDDTFAFRGSKVKVIMANNPDVPVKVDIQQLSERSYHNYSIEHHPRKEIGINIKVTREYDTKFKHQITLAHPERIDEVVSKVAEEVNDLILAHEIFLKKQLFQNSAKSQILKDAGIEYVLDPYSLHWHINPDDNTVTFSKLETAETQLSRQVAIQLLRTLNDLGLLKKKAKERWEE